MAKKLPFGMTSDDVLDVSDIDKDRVEKVRTYIAVINEYEMDLTETQYSFVQDMKAKLKQYDDMATFSDAQYGWLKGLWERFDDSGTRRHSKKRRR